MCEYVISGISALHEKRFKLYIWHIGGYKWIVLFNAVTTLLPLSFANTDQIRGRTVRTDPSNTLIHYSR